MFPTLTDDHPCKYEVMKAQFQVQIL